MLLEKLGIEIQERDKIANIMKVGRKLRGLSQIEMAEALGISQGKVSKLESGLLVPDAGCWYTFCQQLNVNPDFTFNTGYLFTSIKEKKLTGVFKLGKIKNGSIIKIKECIPFILAIKELGLYDDFLVYTKKLKIDVDVFYVPDYSVSVEVLKIVFNFLSNNLSEKKFISLASKNYVNEINVLAPGVETSISKLIKNLNNLDSIFDIEENKNKLKILLDQTFKYSTQDEDFMNTLFSYKTMQLKQMCKDVYQFKCLKVNKISPFEIELSYSA